MRSIKSRSLSTNKKKHLNVGFMVDALSESYQQEIFFAVDTAARSLGINLICFDGGGIKAIYEYEANRNYIYQFISSEIIDGLILLTGTLVHYCGINGIMDYIKMFKPLPVISLSQEIPGIPSILVDNRSGTRETVQHLVKEHHVRRIAYIGGPSSNQDAIERLQTFQTSLSESGIPFYENLYFQGDFTRESGSEGIRKILKGKKAMFDAVMAANDNMALGAMETLKSLGKNSPEDIIITGFDDIKYGQNSFPSLTSVAQPLKDIGKRAIDNLLHLIKGEEVAMVEQISTKLVKRESCGCYSNLFSEIEPGPGLIDDKQECETPDNFAETVCNKIVLKLNDVQPAVNKENLLELLNLFYQNSFNDKKSDFIIKWNNFISRDILSGRGSVYYQIIIYEIGRQLKYYLKDDPNTLNYAEILLQQARTVIAEKELRCEKNRQNLFLEEQRNLDTLRENLLSMFDEKNILLTIKRFLPLVGVNEYFITEFEKEEKGSYNLAKLLLSGENGKAREKFKRVMPSIKLIKGITRSFQGRKTWIIEAISHFNQIGFILMEVDTHEKIKLYSDIRRIISTAMQGSLLFNQFSEQTMNLQKQSRALQKNVKYLRKIMGAVIQTLAMTVEAKDPYTAGHEKRVSDLARMIATEMKLPKDQIEAIRLSAVVHDLGKLYVPSEILNKPGKLREAEFNLIKLHPEIAYDILKHIEFPWPLADIVYCHHERLDGSGYPRSLKGDDIGIEARIISVADVVEAMSSHRPYRPALGIESALKEIEDNKGRFYDPAIVDICVDLFTNKKYHFKNTNV